MTEWNDGFERHEHEKAERLRGYPTCVGCGERIQDETRFYIENDYWCPECARANFEEPNMPIEYDDNGFEHGEVIW